MTGAAFAGCLGAPTRGETETREEVPDSQSDNITLEEGLEEPAGGSELAGSAGDGKPDWIDAHNMRFRGWYYADNYEPGISYHRQYIRLAIVNRAGYTVHIEVLDDIGNTLHDRRLPFANGWYFSNLNARTAKIRVLGSAQSEAIEIDLASGAQHEVWFSGAVLTASYWVGRW
ncbi:hypothetical protein [Natronocalculus amylovorans]|uniref:Uncharacterized protein n=1 Tax=Natronocalculus amylovorans TaxID=2917812 RepID=A0AAE3FXY6_9EURY|nr:hypothetical protein [Natronocalculus amylovorans]MCL9817448.1 hypothetical protein [Natronocalculus amylovorans]